MSLVYFTDRDLGKRFPQILRDAGLTVERHDDHFSPWTPDEEWLATVGERGWVAITHDRRIRYKPNELEAVIANRVALLVLVGKSASEELAQAFVATHPAIERFISKRSPPFVAKVFRGARPASSGARWSTGRIELWFPISG